MGEYKSIYCGGDWGRTINLFLEHDLEVIEKLKLEPLRDGSFREPILISEKGDTKPISNPNSDSCDEDLDEMFVLDGTHRLITAYLLEVPELEVYEGYPEIDGDTAVVTELRVNSNFNDDTFELVCDSARSLFINGDLWTTSASASANANLITIIWDTQNPDDTSLIDTKFSEDLSKVIPKLLFETSTFLDLNAFDYSEEDSF